MVTTDKRRVATIRSRMLGILLTPAEWEEIDAYFAARNVTNSSGARDILLAHIRRDKPANKGESNV